MKVVHYNTRLKNDWNNMLQQATNASFLFQREFMEYHGDRFCDHSLLLYEGKKLVALLPAHLEDGVLCSHFGLSYGGIIHASSLTFTQFIAIIEALAQYCKLHDISSVILNEIPVIYSQTPTNNLAFLSNALRGNLLSVQLLSTLDLASPNPLNTNRKRMIQKGKKQGYYIAEDPSATSFWQAVLEPRLQARYHTTPVHSLEEITHLMQAFPTNIKQMNVYNAQGEIVGGTTLFIHPQVVHLQYIAGKEEDNKNGALDLLMYTLMEQYKSTKRYFDFGSSHSSPKQLNPGLLYWKESFGARSVPQYCYALTVENLLQAPALIGR
ncbi:MULTISPECIES: GNAT family N-acetyltransferase [unclassified Myroides]|uniref:GNAT family N-acetyltransferase n=1 Tax=unclassified Myroides TaxID=2642485 RepID=UPI003D2F7F9F